MQYVKVLISAVSVLAAVPLVTRGADFDGSKPLICSINAVTECSPTDGCQNTTIDNVGMPPFLKVDAQHKTVTAVKPIEGRKPTPIERIERIEGKLILQGAEPGIEEVHDALGWTAAISETTGKLIFTASGDEVAFVAFGACMAQ
jgi:hypothetical protein